MKKFFEDNISILQSVTPEVAKHLWKLDDFIAEKASKTEKFIVCHFYRSNNNYSVQVAFNTLANNSNNGYLVMIFDDDENLFGHFSYRSRTLYPPVWNREFGYMDYTDNLGIQKAVNKILKECSKPEFDYDLSPERMCFYYTKEDQQFEIPKILEDGGKYSIIAVFAWKSPESVEQARKIMGFV